MINFTPPKDSVKKEKEKEEKEEKSKTGFIPPSNSVAKKEKDVVKTADAAEILLRLHSLEHLEILKMKLILIK